METSLAFAGPQNDAMLMPNAYAGQAGRAGADFTWCIGNPGCTRVGGTKPAIVKYIAGANRFGGTMQMMISAGGNPSRLVVQNGLAGIVFQPLAVLGPRPTGAGYAFVQTDPSVSGSAWAHYMTTGMHGLSMGRITMGTTYLGPRPGTEVVNYGFPFTTGRVIVRKTGTRLGRPATETLSAVGRDEVTSMGARNLSLVARALAAPVFGGPELRIAQLSLPEPSPVAQQLAGARALLAAAAWRARRARR